MVANLRLDVRVHLLQIQEGWYFTFVKLVDTINDLLTGQLVVDRFLDHGIERLIELDTAFGEHCLEQR